MIWLKYFDKDYNDPQAHIAAKLYHRYLKPGSVKDKLGKHYSEVIAPGNKAEKEVYYLINEVMGDVQFTGVANIRLDESFDKKEGHASEFDFILEEKRYIIYINTKFTDRTYNQEKQINRHTNILLEILPPEKELIVLGVVTADNKFYKDFKDKLNLYKSLFTAVDDTFCRKLRELDRPKLYISSIMNQLRITIEDFQEGCYEEFTREVQKLEEKIRYQSIIRKINL